MRRVYPLGVLAVDHGPPASFRRAPDPGHDLVADRPGDPRVSLREDAVPEQRHGRPHRELPVELDGERVHRDGADDPAQLAADSYLRPREVAAEAVRVAH